MKWFKGPTILEAMHAVPIPVKECDIPLCSIVTGTFNIHGVGIVAIIKVITGVLYSGMSILIGPSNIVTQIGSI